MDPKCMTRIAQAMRYKLDSGAAEDEVKDWTVKRFGSRVVPDYDAIRKLADQQTEHIDSQLNTAPVAAPVTQGRVMYGPLTNQRVDVVSRNGNQVRVKLPNGTVVGLPAASVRMDAPVVSAQAGKNISNPAMSQLKYAVSQSSGLVGTNKEVLASQRSERFGKPTGVDAQIKDFASGKVSWEDANNAVKSSLSGSYNLTKSIEKPVNLTDEDLRDITKDGLKAGLSAIDAWHLNNAVKSVADAKNPGMLEAYDLKLLRRVYGKDITDAMNNLKPSGEDNLWNFHTLMGVIRSTQTGFDRGGFRQLAPYLAKKLVFGQGKQIAASYNVANDGIKDNTSFHNYIDGLYQSPEVMYAKKMGLPITLDRGDVTKEEMGGSHYIESKHDSLPDGHPLKPVLSSLIKSNRFHEILLNEARLQSFAQYHEKMKAAGMDDDETMQHIAQAVGIVTGRWQARPASSGPEDTNNSFVSKNAEGTIKGLGELLLAPRFRAARAVMADPVVGTAYSARMRIKGQSEAANIIDSHRAAYAAITGLMIMAAKTAKEAGAPVDFGTDPGNSATFGKLVVGEQTYDFGGMSRVLRTGMQMAAAVPYQNKKGKNIVRSGPGTLVQDTLANKWQKTGSDGVDLLRQDAAYGSSPLGLAIHGYLTGGKDVFDRKDGTPADYWQGLAASMLPMIGMQTLQSFQQGNADGGTGEGIKRAGMTLPAEYYGVNVGQKTYSKTSQ